MVPNRAKCLIYVTYSKWMKKESYANVNYGYHNITMHDSNTINQDNSNHNKRKDNQYKTNKLKKKQI